MKMQIFVTKGKKDKTNKKKKTANKYSFKTYDKIEHTISIM